MSAPKKHYDYVLFHQAFYEDDRIAGLSHGAFRAWVEGICLADRLNTDGKLTARKIKTLTQPRFRQELIDAKVWLETDDGIEIAKFLDWQRSAAEKEEQRRKKSEAGRKGGLASGEARREAKDEADASADASGLAQANGEANSKQRESESQRSKGLNVFKGSNGSLPFDKETELDKLLSWVGAHADQGTAGVIRSLADKTTNARLAEVREDVAKRNPHNRAAYVVGALKEKAGQP